MKYSYKLVCIRGAKVKSVPHFRYFKPGAYNSSIGRLTNFIGPGEGATAAPHFEPLSRVRGAILELSPGFEVCTCTENGGQNQKTQNLRRKITLSVPTHAY